jgi:TolA-binding protein
VAPQAEPGPQNARDVIGLASRTSSSPDQQQPNAILLNLDGVRQSIDRIATSIASGQGRLTSSADRIATTQEQIGRSVDRIATTQEEITRSVDQLTANQEQMTREITKLQETEQSIRSKNSEPSMRPASASTPKHVSRPVPASASASAPKPDADPDLAGTDGPLMATRHGGVREATTLRAGVVFGFSHRHAGAGLPGCQPVRHLQSPPISGAATASRPTWGLRCTW